jgi:hypothetical protein
VSAATCVIERAELVEIIDQASAGCVESTRAKLRAVAETTDAVAVGWWHCDGETCPSRQARRTNKHFQEAFDRAMYERFGRPVVEAVDGLADPFVVRVLPLPSEGTER